MRDDPTTGQLSSAQTAVASVGAGASESTLVFPRLALPDVGVRTWRPPMVVARPAYGIAALAALFAGCLVVVVFAAAAPSVLVPGSGYAFPGWVAGPLHGLFGHLSSDARTLSYGFSAVAVAMCLAYAVALASWRRLGMRTIVVAVVAFHAVLLVGPPLQLTDLFNYLGYARLGGLHHLNPYTHVIAATPNDPIYGFTSWRHLRSPYGPAFTLATYPLSWLPLPAAYWTLKTATVIASLALVALVWRCARQLGRDPRLPILLLVANPIFLLYEIGGFHNDVFMLVPAMAAISLVLDRRDGWAGSALMVAVAVKFTAVLLVPFLLVAVRSERGGGGRVQPEPRQLRLLGGMAGAGLLLAAASVAAFGLATSNLSDQTTLLTPFSGPNLVGLMLGLGGGTQLVRSGMDVALVVLTVGMLWLAVRGRCDWISAAGFATLGLLASLAWLTPWYVVWALPLAGLGTSARVRRLALWSTLFLVLSSVPATAALLGQIGVNPMGTAVDRAVNADAMRLAG